MKAHFRVPDECYPCVYMTKVGRFKPGQVVALDAEQRPSVKLVPVNDEAYLMLVELYGTDKVEARHGKNPTPLASPEPVIEPKPVEKEEPKRGKKKRIADSE